MSNQYKYISKTYNYLCKRYEGFIGVPNEMIHIEVGCKPYSLPIIVRDGGMSFKYWDFMDCAETINELNAGDING